MKENLKLCDLVELALGCPKNGAVDFSVLKTLLYGILSSTQTSELCVNPLEEKENFSRKGLKDSEKNVDEEAFVKQQSKHIGDGPKNGEIKEIKNVGTGVKNVDSKSINPQVNSLEFLEMRNDNVELRNLEEKVERLSENHNKLLKRLKFMERKNGIYDLMPSGKDLLEIKKRDDHQGNTGETHDDSNGVIDTESQQKDKRSKFVAGDDCMRNDFDSDAKSKLLNNTWQNVRVNKRLQVIEDGMEKLFSMLDILTDEQKRLGFIIKNKELKSAGNADNEDLNVSTKISSDEMNEFGLKLRNDLDRKLKDLINDSNDRIKEDIHKLTGDISKLEKRLLDLEMIKNDNTGKKSIQNSQDFNHALQELKESLKFDFDNVKNILNGVVLREELAEYVKWPDLEEALNVRGFKTKVNEEMLDNLKDENEKAEEKTDEGDLISFDNQIDQNDEKATSDSPQNPPAEKINNSDFFKAKHPSEEMKECLRRISNVAVLYEELESKLNQIANEQESLVGKSKVEGESLQLLLKVIQDKIESTTQIAECNKSLIDTTRAELDNLIKNQQQNQSSALNDNDVIDIIKGKMLDLEDKGNDTSMALNHLNNNMQNELRAKQQLIDALYECVEQLQRNKADVTNATSIFDLEAYKNALDAKVSMSEFDETMANLENNLREVVERIEQYTNEEEGLKNALAKISDDVRDKLDAKAGESLKKYLESRIAQLQKSRENLASRAGKDFLSNAAGVRRPLASLFHCISCDRPVNIPGMPLPTISQRFPKKKNRKTFYEMEKADLGFGKSNSLNSLAEESNDNNNDKRQLELWNDAVATSRPCGGSHTAFPYAVKKPGKHVACNQSNTLAEANKLKKLIAENYTREKSIVDLLLGTDGQVYRGRYRKNDLSKNIPSSSFDRRGLRSRSAEVPRQSGISLRRKNGPSSLPNSELSSPRSLPPLFHESSLTNTPVVSMATNRSEPNLKGEQMNNKTM